ncbi:MAG TPA: zinc ribbon domain-containing protein, partial [Anaerolineaceae bacterium]|nr:zinc ribbon domain-containing protein [Anaerolineaceae bacterium]
SVAMQDVDNLLYNINYTTADDGDWVKVSFIAPSQNVQLEYYSPLTKTGQVRNIVYTWPADYKVNNLIFRVQQPVNATQMTIMPTQGSSAKDQDGITYYTNPVGAVAEGTVITIKINYTKSDDKLTSVLIPPRPSTPIPTGQTNPSNLLQVLNNPLVAIMVGVVLVGGGAFWLFSQRQTRRVSAFHRHRGVTTNPGREAVAEKMSGDEAVYCHQCGKRAGVGDVFCRSCGTRLHV